MRIEQILWEGRMLLLMVYTIVAFCVAVIIIPPETPLNELMLPLNILFVPVWAGLFIWWYKTRFRDLFEKEDSEK